MQITYNVRVWCGELFEVFSYTLSFKSVCTIGAFTALSGKRAGRSMENLHGNMLGRVQASAQSKPMKKRVSIVCGTPHREGTSVQIMDYVQQKRRVACNQVPQDC